MLISVNNTSSMPAPDRRGTVIESVVNLRNQPRPGASSLEFVEHIGAGPRHRRVGYVAAGQRRPAALLDE